MNKSVNPILDAIAAERAQLNARLQVLAEIERKLGSDVPVTFVGIQERAPSGELKKAMLAALKGETGILSADLRKKIMANGWSHKLNPQYATKVLKSLVKAKAVMKIDNGAYSLYSLRSGR